MTRRTFLFGVTAAGVLAACGGDGDGSESAPTDSDEDEDDGSSAGGSTASPDSAELAAGTYTLIQRFPQAVQTPGEIRLPFSLSTGAAEFVSDGPETLGAQVLDADGAPVGDRLVATRRSIEPAAYYAFRADLDTPGFYSLVIDGGPEGGASFDVADPATVVVPQPGDDLAPFDTPTTEEPAGVDPICTRDPACPFHDRTLTEALSTGRPVVYYVGTPAFCQTGSCAPALEALIDASPDYDGEVEFVHAEVYTDLTATEVTAAVEQLGLQFEPTLLVTDAAGAIVERLDAVFDESELRESIDRALR